jgi:glyoxylase-like metal-dependent hydrolase (beta-lactamase superfamily II)
MGVQIPPSPQYNTLQIATAPFSTIGAIRSNSKKCRNSIGKSQVVSFTQSYRAGETSVHLIKVGDFKTSLSQQLNVPEKDWQPKYRDLFEKEILSPSNSALVRTAGSVIVVDPNDFVLTFPPQTYPSSDYEVPPDLVTQLEGITVKTEDVTDVVITHAHYDHYAAVTRQDRSGKYTPTFPNAKYYLGAADWEHPMVKQELQEENSGARNSLGVLHEQKVLELVTGSKILNSAVRIIPAPGESPGHQILEVQSSGQTFYFIGDLFHHWVEVEEPNLNVTWADPKQNAVSKRMLREAASSRNALVIAGHMEPGKIRKKNEDGAFEWEEEKKSP